MVVTSHQFGASSAEDVSLLDPRRPRTLLSMDVSLKEGSLATYWAMQTIVGQRGGDSRDSIAMQEQLGMDH